MGLSQSLWTGLSGLKSFQTWTDSVGNNLANASTEGYKCSQVSFSDLLYNTSRSARSNGDSSSYVNPDQTGYGVGISSIVKNFEQGSFENTDRTFDCALEGNGFFVMELEDNSEPYYSRNGSFYLGAPESADALTQTLYSSDGYAVQGYNATNGILGTTLDSITVPRIGTIIDGSPTTEITLSGNINAAQPVIEGNTVETFSGTTGTGFLSDNGSTVNIGGVQSTGALINSDNEPATADTDLTELYFDRGNQFSPLLSVVPDGYTAESRELTVEFKKGDSSYQSATFTYGKDGTTLEDLCNWLCGGLGDDGTSDTQRLDGGALGTVRTREYTEDLDGFYAPAEQAGAYLDYAEDGSVSLAVASNLGLVNNLNSFRITSLTTATDEEGNPHNYQQVFTDFLEENKTYQPDYNGGTAVNNFNVYVTDTGETGNIDMEGRTMRYSLLNRDSEGSTWRWMLDGYTEGDEGFNQGTGIIRFSDAKLNGQSQVSTFTTDGNTPYSYNTDEITQLASTSSTITTTDGYDYGTLDEFVIDEYGVIQGNYSNGVVEDLSKLATALFPNQQGLTATGSTMFQRTVASGNPVYNSNSDNPEFPRVLSNWLESSNVDMSREMSNLLLSQRSYQLSSRVITTADDMLQEAAALKK